MAAEKHEQARAQQLRWYYRNREYVADRTRRRRARDPEFVAANKRRVAEWLAANPERAAELRRRGVLRYRARKHAALVEEVDPLVVLERCDGACGICGEDVDPNDFHVDHIVPLSRGGLHNYENTQAAHPPCNQRKSAQVGFRLMPEGGD